MTQQIFDDYVRQDPTGANTYYDTYENIQINGRRLFPSQSSMRSHLPTTDVAARFIQIVSGINDATGFTNMSKFDKLITLDFNTQESSERSQVRNYLTSGKDDIDKCGVMNTNNDTFHSFEFTTSEIDSSLLSTLVTDLTTDIDNLKQDNVKPLSHGTHLSNYRTVFKNLCKNIFNYHYAKLQTEFPAITQQVSDNEIATKTGKLLTYLENNSKKDAERFSGECDDDDLDDTYSGNVYNLVMNYTDSNTQIDASFKKAFYMCYFPFFYFDFIMNNVAPKDQSDNDTAPRYFFVHRIAVLAVYVCMFLAVKTIIDNVNPSTQLDNFGSLINILSTINDELFSRETLETNSSLGYQNLQTDTEATFSASNILQMKNSEITAIRNNLSKAAIKEVEIRPKIKRSKIFLILWSIFFALVFIASILLLYVFPVDQQRGPFWIFLVVIAVIVFIAWLIDVIRTSKI